MLRLLKISPVGIIYMYIIILEDSTYAWRQSTPHNTRRQVILEPGHYI